MAGAVDAKRKADEIAAVDAKRIADAEAKREVDKGECARACWFA
jgi:hypothetical protein